jgi:L-ribulose-5-phosphate 3-epimerase UlaE
MTLVQQLLADHRRWVFGLKAPHVAVSVSARRVMTKSIEAGLNCGSVMLGITLVQQWLSDHRRWVLGLKVPHVAVSVSARPVMTKSIEAGLNCGSVMPSITLVQSDSSNFPLLLAMVDQRFWVELLGTAGRVYESHL